MSKKIRTAALCTVLAAIVGAATVIGAANPQVTTAYSGEALYLANCSNCHGSYAEGSGPIAADLTKTPPDLRHLSAANGGVFPRERVFDIIDGRVIVAAHGTREMPVWGRAFTALDTDAKSPTEAEANTEAKITVLVDFLAGIQQR